MFYVTNYNIRDLSFHRSLRLTFHLMYVLEFVKYRDFLFMLYI